jgi:hypothetical protein
MTDTKQIVEQRKHKRFKVLEGAFAALRSPWPHSTRLGQIIDISMGGLAFGYIDIGGETGGPSELDIVLSVKNFYLYKVPFKEVSDFQMNKEVPFTFFVTRRCSVQFGELTQDQKHQIAYFVENYTTEEA